METRNDPKGQRLRLAFATATSGWLLGSLPGLCLLIAFQGAGGLGNALSTPALGSLLALVTSIACAASIAAVEARRAPRTGALVLTSFTTFAAVTLVVALLWGATGLNDPDRTQGLFLGGLVMIAPVTLLASLGSVLGRVLQVRFGRPRGAFFVLVAVVLGLMIVTWLVASGAGF